MHGHRNDSGIYEQCRLRNTAACSFALNLSREWSALAREWDAWSGYTDTKPILSSEEEAHFRGATEVLRWQRKSGQIGDLMFALRMDLRRAGNFEFMHRHVVEMMSLKGGVVDRKKCVLLRNMNGICLIAGAWTLGRKWFLCLRLFALSWTRLLVRSRT